MKKNSKLYRLKCRATLAWFKLKSKLTPKPKLKFSGKGHNPYKDIDDAWTEWDFYNHE